MTSRKVGLPVVLTFTLAACAGDDTVIIPDGDPPTDVQDLDVIEWLDTGTWEKDADDASPDAPTPDDATTPDATAPDAFPPDAPPEVSTVDAPGADVLRDIATADTPRDVAVMDAPRDVAADVAADVARDAPVDAPGYAFPTPIRHVIVLIRENRTFDNLFTGFPNAETTTRAPLSTGGTTALRRAPDGNLPGDIRHTHNGATMAFAGGAMDGFDRNARLYSDTHDPLGPFIHYAESQIPSYWHYARRYVLCDHFFSTTLTQSSPGHFAFWTAQTPHIDNPDCPGTSCDRGSGCFATSASTVTAINQNTCALRTTPVAPCFDVPTVVDNFPTALTWKVYASANDAGIVSSPLAMARGITRDRAAFMAHTARSSTLVGDLEGGRQANLIIAHMGGAAGEHPPFGLCAGENFAVQVINAVMRGPYWRDTAILLTYDDWGGFYDHVRPPQERCSNGDHMHLGFRLPLVVVSPYTRRSTSMSNPWVFHDVTEQASVTRLVEDVFRLPRLHARDAHARDSSAGSLMGVFDFAHPDFTTSIRTTRSCP